MLDAATISGLIRPVKFTDANRFQQVAFLQENGTTFKHTDGYYQSPLTGAQFRMTPVKERHKNDIYWRLHIWLPVNAILRGQNYLLGEHTNGTTSKAGSTWASGSPCSSWSCARRETARCR